MKYDRQITISTAKHRTSTEWKREDTTFSGFSKRLENPLRDTEKMADYLTRPKAQQDDSKDVGGFVGGALNGPRRKSSAVTGRDIITLDFDNIPGGGVDTIVEKMENLGCGYCIYSTRKHTPEAPRVRVVIPTDRTMTPDEYEPCARRIAQQINMAWVDPTTFEIARLMYWPSCCADGEYFFKTKDAPLIGVDFLLGTYANWRDFASWPQVPGRSYDDIRRQIQKQADPESKDGIVGAFCRSYDIHRAIAELIPEAYTPVAGADDRYTFTGGSTTGGAVVYDNGKFLFSHHSTDPCSGKLVNAFDLVRLHKFGRLDDSYTPDTPMNSRPSFREMCTFAETLPDVAAELERMRREQAISDFSGIEAPPATGSDDPDDTDVICLEDVEEREPDWLVQGYIPKGEITVLAGDGGVGKTFAWCSIAAAISSGNLCFMLNNLFQEHPQHPPQKVMYFSAEDSNEAVLRPRLRENGAVLKNVITIDSTDERFQKIKLDSPFLEKLIAKHRPALCIFDPLQAFLPRGVNMIARNDMRQAMSKLHVFGARYGTTFLIIMHTNKKSDVSGRNRLADSADIWDIARSVLIAGKASSTGCTRYVSHEKSSYGKESQTVLFRISGKNAVEFASYTDKRDRDFVQALAKESRTAPTKEAAEQFIIDYLTDRGQSPMNELDEAARVFYTPHTIRDAKASLKAAGKITIQPTGEGKNKGVKWCVSLGK